MTIDGKDVTPYLFVEHGESAYPCFQADFETAEGDTATVSASGGYNGTLYNSRLEKEEYRQCTIAGYPALCYLSNEYGTIKAYYIIVMGHQDRQTSDGAYYEEDIEVTVVLDGDYSDDFLKDLFGGAEHPELDERLDSYASGFVNAVIYTPGEGSTPVEKAA